MNDAKLISRAVPLVRRNESIIKRLIDDRDEKLSDDELDTISLVNNKVIRDHFMQLTTTFLSPFNV